MRKNAPRKWIHAILDLLPLLVIPIFTIYSQRHEINTNSVTIIKDVDVLKNFKQEVFNPQPNGDDDMYIDGSIDNGDVFINIINGEYYCSLATNFSFSPNDIVYCSFEYNWDANKTISDCSIGLLGDNEAYYASLTLPIVPMDDTTRIFSKVSKYITNNLTYNETISFMELYFNCYNGEFGELFLRHFQTFNVTEIFGSGNEPTIDVFESYLTQPFYSYGDNLVKIGTTTVTTLYNDSDIGSQFIYQMYNVTDKYFNFNSLFNMQSVYEWLQLNLFGGNAPLPVTIVWNIIVYEFFVDLIFLLYSVFMFFIDFATNMIDSFTHRNGGR